MANQFKLVIHIISVSEVKDYEADILFFGWQIMCKSAQSFSEKK